MGDTATADVELTEFEAIDVTRIDGVKSAANGFPILMMKGLSDAAEPGSERAPGGVPAWHSPAALLVRMGLQERDADKGALFKAVNAEGLVDEQPDIDAGQQAIALVARLIGYEAQELGAGHLGEIRDIGQLCEAASCLRWWLNGELAGQQQEDGMPCPCGCGWTVVAQSIDAAGLGKAQLSASAINDLPDSAFAYIEDGGTKDAGGKTTPRSKRHFPIHDLAHADNAAARIAQGAKFGDKAKAKVVAAQRKFGEKSDDAGKSTVADQGAGVDTSSQGSGSGEDLAKAVADAVTKATAPLQKRLEALDAELAKVKATPIPGGPVLSAAARQSVQPALDDYAAKAAYYTQMADTVSDRQSADGYRILAREYAAKARETTTPG